MSVRLRGAKPNSSIASIGGTLWAKKVGHFMFPFRPARASLNYVEHDRTAGECGDPRSPRVGSADRCRAAAAAVTQAYISCLAGCTHAYVVHRQLQSENCPRTIIAVWLVMRIRVARSIGDCFLLGTAQEPVNWALTCSSPNDNQFRQNCPGKWQATTCRSF
jgi:hypothetical protein